MSLKGTIEFTRYANASVLPGGAANGTVVWVESEQGLFTYRPSGWGKLVANKGDISNPALSPAQIIADGGDSSGDGIYYYTLNNVTTPIYTNFSYNDPTHGRGWMLAGTIASGTTFNIISANWSNTNMFGSKTDYTTQSNMKNEAWLYYASNVVATQYQLSSPNSSNNWFNFTHNQNTTLCNIFNWDNVNNGYLTFNEQFDTSGGYNTQLNDYLNKIGYTGARNGAPYGRLGLNAFMSTSSSGTRMNWNQINSGDATRSGVRLGYLGDNTVGGPVWPGQNGGPDDFGIGCAVQTCYDAGSCNVIVNTTYPGHYRLYDSYNGDTGMWFTRCHIWVK